MKTRTIGLALAAATLLSVAACGSSSSTKTVSQAPPPSAAAPVSSSASTAGGLAAEVPAAVKTKGTLTVAADASYAPNEFIDKDGKTVIGMDADLAAAIGQQLGLKVTVANVAFDNIIPGIQAGRYDLGMSSFTDNKKREMVVDMVDYFSAGTSFFTKTGGPSVTSLDGLCGLSVSVEKGTTQQDDATGQSKTCTTAGKKAVKVLVLNDQGAANLALSSGRATVSMADSPVAAYQVKESNGAFVLSGAPYGTAPYGIAVPKNGGLAKPVQDAMTALVKDGEYLKILTKWGVQAGAVTTIGLNGATS